MDNMKHQQSEEIFTDNSSDLILSGIRVSIPECDQEILWMKTY